MLNTFLSCFADPRLHLSLNYKDLLKIAFVSLCPRSTFLSCLFSVGQARSLSLSLALSLSPHYSHPHRVSVQCRARARSQSSFFHPLPTCSVLFGLHRGTSICFGDLFCFVFLPPSSLKVLVLCGRREKKGAGGVSLCL